MMRRSFASFALSRLTFALGLVNAAACSGFFGTPVTASQVYNLTRELAGIVDSVASRILGPNAKAAGVPESLAPLVEEVKKALDVATTAADAARRANENGLIEPSEARYLFARFLRAYESLWLALKAAGMLGPNGELLGVGDGGLIPSPADCKQCVARHLGEST